MAPSRTAKAERGLVEEEASFRARLLEVLPPASASGHDLFTNSEFNPYHLNQAQLSLLAEELLGVAKRCIARRQELRLLNERSIGELFIIACREGASSSPHRRGPRRLAAWLLSELQNAA
jgi:hypothetical protein